MLDEHVDLIDGPEVETRELSIPTDLHGERLDRALAVLLPEFSRSYSQQLLSEGCVSCVIPAPRAAATAATAVVFVGLLAAFPALERRPAEKRGRGIVTGSVITRWRGMLPAAGHPGHVRLAGHQDFMAGCPGRAVQSAIAAYTRSRNSRR